MCSPVDVFLNLLINLGTLRNTLYSSEEAGHIIGGGHHGKSSNLSHYQIELTQYFIRNFYLRKYCLWSFPVQGITSWYVLLVYQYHA